MRTKPSKANFVSTKNQKKSNPQTPSPTAATSGNFDSLASEDVCQTEHTSKRSLRLAQKRKFLELRSNQGRSKEDATKLSQLVSSFVQWCAKRKMPGIVVRHQGEQSLVSVYVPYPQLDRVRSLLQEILPAAHTETSAATQYYFTYECPNTSMATKLASSLASRLGQQQTSL